MEQYLADAMAKTAALDDNSGGVGGLLGCDDDAETSVYTGLGGGELDGDVWVGAG